MSYRSIASATISFGLVSIPVKFYLACNAETVSFHMLTKDRKRVRQQLVEDGTGKEVVRSETLKGYEYAKDEYAVFTAEEVKALEESEKGVMEIVEFVPASTVDSLHVEKAYYVGPGKGGDKAYNLLARVLKAQDKVAVAQWLSRGRKHLVTIKAYEDGLLVQQMFYQDEVRPFECDTANTVASDAEVEMANLLVETMTKPAYEPSKFEDTFRKRVQEAVEAKLKSSDVSVSPAVPVRSTVDLFEALKASLNGGSTPEPAPSAPKKRARRSKKTQPVTVSAE